MHAGDLETTTHPHAKRLAHAVQWTGLAAGPLLALAVHHLAPDTLPKEGRRVLAVMVWMAAWWLTEAIPISATALLPLVLLPMLGVSTMKQAAAPYADEVIFLFVGGFILGEALRASGLHRRIAIGTLLAVGTSPSRIVGGIMLVTCLISMWVSNTATTIMMLPIGMSLVALVERCAKSDGAAESGWTPEAVRHLTISIVLGIAYAASIGGLGTPIGTPPNVIMRGQAEALLKREIGFGEWVMIAAPLSLVFCGLAWLTLTRLLHRVRAGHIAGGRDLMLAEKRSLGKVTRAEWITAVVFIGAATGWVLRTEIVRVFDLTMTANGKPVPLLTDAGIAVAAALMLVLIPVSVRRRQFVVSAESLDTLPWGILLLFGGGTSIAEAMSRTGVDKFLGSQFAGMSGLPQGLVLFVLIAAIVFGGELASNVAVVTALMPVLAAAAEPMGMDPLTLMFAAALAASCGFMLPVATPPNALAFATRKVTQSQMIRAGLLLDLVGIALLTGLMILVRGRLFGTP
ncbi:MAG: SLC13/DASS family transporter [Phycisphaerales bacterium]|nr:SLC13/DASS family transporter [Phycisphaerales bacterium]